MLERASRSHLVIGLVSITFLVGAFLAFFISTTQAVEPGTPQFQRTWERTDKPVKDGQVSRTWMWGPEAFTDVMTEPYAESPGGMRQVQYFDKSRMEINDPNKPDDGLWFVTNGLLVVEMITGQMQTGDNSFEARQASMVNVAGDPDDPTGPTYASFATHLGPTADRTGQTVTQRITRNGEVVEDGSLASQAVTLAYFDSVTGHNVAQPFWDFMNSSGLVYQDGQYVEAQLFINPFYATGRPITEPYFADVKVAGTVLTVLMQCFERRCMTYTPTNNPGFQVEAGNVGLHYFCWRYGYLPEGKGQCIGSPVTPVPTQPGDGDGDGDGDGGNGTPVPPGQATPTPDVDGSDPTPTPDVDGSDPTPTPDVGGNDPTPTPPSGTDPGVDVSLNLGTISISALGGGYTVPVQVTNTGTQSDSIVVELDKSSAVSTCGPNSDQRTITLGGGQTTTVNFSQSCGILSLDVLVDYTATATINRAPGASDTDSDDLLITLDILPGDDPTPTPGPGGGGNTLDVLPLNYGTINLDLGLFETFSLPVRVKNNGDSTLNNVNIRLRSQGISLCAVDSTQNRTIAPGATVTVNFNVGCLLTADLLATYTATATSGSLSDTETDQVLLRVGLIGGGDDPTPTPGPGGGGGTVVISDLPSSALVDVDLLNADITIPIEITNNGSSSASGTLQLDYTGVLTLCAVEGTQAFNLSAGQSQTISFSRNCLISLGVADEYTATVRVNGSVTDQASFSVLIDLNALNAPTDGFLANAA